MLLSNDKVLVGIQHFKQFNLAYINWVNVVMFM